MMTDHARILDVSDLVATYAGVARHLGAAEADALLYAQSFARADLRHNTQGLPLWLEFSLPMAEASEGRFAKKWLVKAETESVLSIDGADAFGQIVAAHTMRMLIDKSKRCGSAFGLISNVTDLAMVANYAMQALEHDCIGIVASTAGPANVAPWGSSKGVFGPDPLAVAIPSAASWPLVIDMCCASYSVGTLVEAARTGKTDSRAVVVDLTGNYLNSAAAIVSDVTRREPPLRGAILPEGPKGSAVLLLVEILAGLLSGSGTSHDQNSWTLRSPPRVGAFLWVIDVARFVDLSVFKMQVAAFTALIAATPAANGFDRVIVPGMRAAELEETRRRNGVEVSQKHWDLLVSACERHHVAVPSARASASGLRAPLNG